MTRKIFGKNPFGDRLLRIENSPNYFKGEFQNVEPTSVNPNKVSFFKLLKDFARKPKTVKPGKELPYIKTDLLTLNSGKPAIVWFGHSSYLISSRGFNILVDPVFSGNAAPVKFFGKSFNGADNYKVEDFPFIDVLVITHDHYDHLDFHTVTKFDSKVKKIITPLGVASHLEFWGIDKEKIIELDWWDVYNIDKGIEITAAPARHFSGRSLVRAKTLWASFALMLHGQKIFIGGDSGYDSQFKIIGEKFSGFDVALLECGQYGKNWPQIHMLPEETVKAAKDLKANLLIPVHWSKFILSTHSWNEPIKRVAIAAEKEGQHFVSPLIGQPYIIGEDYDQPDWWDFH